MQPSIFNNTGLGWGGSLCALVNYSRPEAEHRMRKNLEEWITEEDFKQIKALGFDSVRLPIGTCCIK
jgi:aryl-phospho-beta-D-glucosidase BglC (GH1 family)